MKNYIFGYGSLINLQSAAKTLGRTVKDSEVLIVDAKNYTRVWRLVTQVIVSECRDKPVNAVFLDIADQSEKELNGILIKVSINELKKLDIREKDYRRIDITNYIHPQVQDSKVFTYQGKPEFFVENFTNPIILTQYLNVLHQGIQHWGKEFFDKFEATTQPCNFGTLHGAYKFCDKEQNILTGRD